MIARTAALTPPEHRAVAGLVDRALHDAGAPLLAAVLFGSKARGDDDADSDVDVLLIFDTDRDAAIALGGWLANEAERLGDATGVVLEPWSVPAVDLGRGCRTPMLVDALDDGAVLWPPDRPPIRLAFTPADACFCAERLLEWVAEGGPVARRALAAGRLVDAAGRSRDDITRLATAALLLTGDTRHRRAGSLRRFDDRFVGTAVSPAVRPAIAWAIAAFPSDGGRGRDTPSVPAAAAATAGRGIECAATMETHVVPWVLDRIGVLRDDGRDGRLIARSIGADHPIAVARPGA